MKLSFIKTNPTENMTVFILDPLPRSMYSDLSKKIMDYSSICAEQVGFLEKPTDGNGEACVRLHMMGGEFCGNAARALAAVMVRKGDAGIRYEDGRYLVPLEVSGADGVLYCEVSEADHGNYITSIKMPLHRALEETVVPYKGKDIGGTWIQFEGINHLIVDAGQIESKEEFFDIVKESIACEEWDAFGIMFYHEPDGFMEPLVYVRSTDSMVWERGCGSGTTAVGIYTAYKSNREIDMEVRQPGGSLRIRAEWKNREVTAVYLTGDVSIVAEGILYLDK